MKIKEIVTAYKALGDAKVSNLEESEILKIIKARKEMRPIVEDFEAFLKDCQDKFKPENWESFQDKLQQWQKEGDNTTLTEEEKIWVNGIFITYQNNINAAIKEEQEKEVEVNIEKLNDDSISKLLKYNDWPTSKLDELLIML